MALSMTCPSVTRSDFMVHVFSCTAPDCERIGFILKAAMAADERITALEVQVRTAEAPPPPICDESSPFSSAALLLRFSCASLKGRLLICPFPSLQVGQLMDDQHAEEMLAIDPNMYEPDSPDSQVADPNYDEEET
jgi:hypothetical protein